MRKFEASLWFEFFSKAIEYSKDYGSATVRSLVLINGGAVVAILAAVSAIWTDNEKAGASLAFGLSFSITFFVGGLLSAVIAGAMGYFNFQFVAGGVPGPSGLHKYVASGDTSGWRDHRRAAMWTMIVAVAFVAASLCFFAVGSLLALNALGSASVENQ